MREQLTADGMALLAGVIMLFWAGVVVLVRRHARQSRATAADTHRAPPVR